jgi:ribosomal protein S18 acetylase RimI-like enzyme
MIGFGSWKHRQVQSPEGSLQEIVIDWFGVDRAYQGQKSTEGYSWADQLYATVEADACSNSVPNASIALEVRWDNDHAIKFWERQGFRFEEEVFVASGSGRAYRRMIR